MLKYVQRLLRFIRGYKMSDVQHTYCVQTTERLTLFSTSKDGSPKFEETKLPKLFQNTEKLFLLLEPKDKRFGVRNPFSSQELWDVKKKLDAELHIRESYPVFIWEESYQSRSRTYSHEPQISCDTRQGSRKRQVSEGNESHALDRPCLIGLLFVLRTHLDACFNIEIEQLIGKFNLDAKRIMFHSNRWILSNSIDVPLTFGPDVEMVRPAFRHTMNNHVFHSLNEIRLCLRQGAKDKDFKLILSLVEELKDPDAEWTTKDSQSTSNDCPSPSNDIAQASQETNHPFVVIEGLDGTGKSTMARRLADHLNALHMHTPPTDMADIRPRFDDKPPLARRLFYSLANYRVGQEIQRTRKSKPIVLDRFWGSTAAYAIASDAGYGGEEVLPDRGHFIYQWPADLVRPSLILLLDVSEEERDRRMRRREEGGGPERTKEEEQLRADRLFRARVTAAYRRLSGVPLVSVTADGSQDDVFSEVLSTLRKHNIFYPE